MFVVVTVKVAAKRHGVVVAIEMATQRRGRKFIMLVVLIPQRNTEHSQKRRGANLTHPR